MSFQILPAIEILGGHSVQLYKGSYEQVTRYPKAPHNQAEIFTAEGADGLHIVDLDGARSGEPGNLKAIEKICQHVQIPIQVSGGIRSIESVKNLFALGIDRVILGTAAVENPALLVDLLAQYGAEKISISLDTYESGTKLLTQGRQQKTKLDTLDFAETLENLGVQRIIFTDTARDSTLTFPNFDISERLVQTINLQVFVSGGISKLEHIKMLQAVGVAGVIIGKALYEHELSVAEIKTALT
jgi:phosphoribosylformimino-5-aminoimidazole carboxamide ribotide isomerase